MIQPKACSSRPRKPWGPAGSPLMARHTVGAQVHTCLVSVLDRPPSRRRRTSAGVAKSLGGCQAKSSPPCLSWAALETPRPHVWPHPMSPKHFAAPRRSTWPTRRSSRLKLLRAKLKCPEAAPSDCGETSPRRATWSVHAPMPEDVALRRLFGPKTAVHSAQGLFS